MSNISKRTYDFCDNELDAQITNLKEYTDAKIAKIPGSDIDLTEYAKTSDLTSGVIKVQSASSADYASSAGSAGYASSAGSAGYASNASSADYATYASDDTSKGTIDDRLTTLAVASNIFSVANKEPKSATSDFSVASTIYNVPNGRTYLVRVKISTSSIAPTIITFPLYLPPADENLGRFIYSHPISMDLGNSPIDHVSVDGMRVYGSDTYSDVRFWLLAGDTPNITEVEYTIL